MVLIFPARRRETRPRRPASRTECRPLGAPFSAGSCSGSGGSWPCRWATDQSRRVYSAICASAWRIVHAISASSGRHGFDFSLMVASSSYGNENRWAGLRASRFRQAHRPRRPPTMQTTASAAPCSFAAAAPVPAPWVSPWRIVDRHHDSTPNLCDGNVVDEFRRPFSSRSGSLPDTGSDSVRHYRMPCVFRARSWLPSPPRPAPGRTCGT